MMSLEGLAIEKVGVTLESLQGLEAVRVTSFENFFFYFKSVDTSFSQIESKWPENNTK